MRNTRLEVDVNKFISNINKIKNHCEGKEIMPVIKANAYGTYINKKINLINKFNIVAVALVDEGIYLRENGYNNEIFILNQPSIEEIDLIEKNKLTIGISDDKFINELIRKKSKISCHLEIETGMNRTGIKIENLNEIITKISKSNLSIDGVYTHLSSADYDKDYTIKQIETFKKALDILNENKINPKYIHISASNGLLNYKLDFTNLVRPGIIMYGYESYEGANKIIEIEPICKLKTNITYLKECKKNDAISYSQKYICQENKKIATIPIGYADGLKRELSNKGYVIVNEMKCPIVGNICMDSCMIDVSNVENVEVGDEVVIFDNNLITIEEIAKICGTINYEILCTISDRVPRIFIGG